MVDQAGLDVGAGGTMAPTNPVSVLIVVEVCLYREGLTGALSKAEGICVIGSLPNLREASEVIREYQPDIVLLDPTADPGFSLVQLIGRVAPRSSVVAIGVREVEDDVIRCAEAGVAAYVAREASLEDLVGVIEGVAKRELHCSPRIAASLFRRVGALAEVPEMSAPQLTPREREIAALIDEGLSNKQIAQRLQIGLSTVKNHVHNLLTKLNTSRRMVAAAQVRRSRTVSFSGRGSG
jgi:two-component system nitrate/nitrite response regulator NarL